MPRGSTEEEEKAFAKIEGPSPILYMCARFYVCIRVHVHSRAPLHAYFAVRELGLHGEELRI